MVFDKLLKRKPKNEPAELEEASSEAAAPSDDNGDKVEMIDTGMETRPLAPNDDPLDYDSEIDDDMMDQLNDMLEKVDQDAIKKALSRGLAISDTENLDAQIASLMEKAKNESRNLEDFHSADEFINTAEIFDNVDRNKPEPEGPANKGKIMEKVKDTSPKVMYAVIGVMALLIVVTVLIGVIVISMLGKKQPAAEGYQPVSQPSYTSNSANYIFLSNQAEFKGESLVLTKMLIDPVATVFYFNKYINKSAYDISLIDNNGRMYSYDLAYAVVESATTNEPAVLRFEPLDVSAGDITLTIRDIGAGEEAVFKYALNKPLTMPPAVYLNTPVELYSGNGTASVTINNAVFSSSGTQLNYVLNFNDGGFKLQMGKNKNGGYLTMTEAAKTIQPSKKAITDYSFNDGSTLIGRMDFGPVSSLGSKVNFKIDNLYKLYELNQEIDTAVLFLNKEGYEQIIEIDNYSIVLERMGIVGDNAILVFHTEDNSVAVPEKGGTGYSNRAVTEMDIELLAGSAGGMQIAIKGECVSGQAGTDVLFDISKISGLLPSDSVFTLSIQNAKIKLGAVNVSVDLSKQKTSMPTEVSNALQFIKAAFESRLAYKSGEVSLNQISGFSETLLSDTRLMSYYSRFSVSANNEVFYTAQVVSYTFEKNRVLAVVQESWQNKSTGSYLYLTHKIIAEQVFNGWTITDDTILK